MDAQTSHLIRKQLDQRLVVERNEQLHPPRLGWISTLREALGMTATQLARRLKISKPTMAKLERSEREGTITLSSLHKVAEALDCDVKVVLVPRRPLEEMVRGQARKRAEEIIGYTERHMRLEKQGTEKEFQAKQIDALADELIRTRDRRLWGSFDE